MALGRWGSLLQQLWLRLYSPPGGECPPNDLEVKAFSNYASSCFTRLFLSPQEDRAASNGESRLIMLQCFPQRMTWEHLRPSAPKVNWAKAIWFKGSVPKFAFTFWTANLDRLPVRARLVAWGMNIYPLCCLCNQATESRDHLLLHCEYSEQVWEESLRRLGHTRFVFHNWSALITWLSSASVSTPSKLKLIVCHATIYLLWRERNNRHFNSSTTTPTALSRQLDRSARDLLLARRYRKGWQRLLSSWFAHS
ncbi:hypothetical protein V5N11_000721 [Cardamine amara subsp. amara]|uniref:Reverse transcriptase zinc-binding domain-containing protein n=1 Tax=Cardamine amara subsp. amara TaxID=228776 RepID=A0ABD1C105_CARAN